MNEQRVKCRSCKGTGRSKLKLHAGLDAECGTCGGTGRICKGAPNADKTRVRLRRAGSESEIELQSCPFCGGRELEVALYNRPCVVCKTCDADGPGAQRLSVAIDNRIEARREAKLLWNRRANDSETQNVPSVP